VTLVAIPVTPSVEAVSKLYDQDPEAASFLVTLALAETLSDLIVKAGPRLVGQMDQAEAAREDALRRGIVATFIAKRERGEDVTELMQYAGTFSAISKDQGELPSGEPEPRDTRGRWTKFGGRLKAIGDNTDKTAAAFDSFANGGAQTKGAGAGDKINAMDGWGALRATGNAINTLSGGAHPVGALVGAIGNYGPEAEKVVGPHLKRTAYRYRGNSKKPDPELVDAVQQASVEGTKAQIGSGVASGTFNGSPLNRQNGQLTPAQGAAVRNSKLKTPTGPGQTDSYALKVRGDAAAAYLDGHLTDPKLAAISEAAGKVPPSEGVIINAQGQVTAQATGVNGDHYLPFDLKNLSQLHGGQYVRTRGAGGPTTEDIYTGLVSGARQIQVVSNSGVFTVEFDPGLRGGKRFGDQAKGMVDRYGALLGAINDSKAKGLLAQDISPQRMNQLRQQALDDAGGNVERAQGRLGGMIREERDRQSFAFEPDSEIREAATHTVAARVSQDRLRNRTPLTDQQRAHAVDDEVARMTDKARKDQARYYQLDGEGYDTALKALKQEFPYFIRNVKHENRIDFAESGGQQRTEGAQRNATDRSYKNGQQIGTELANRGLTGKVKLRSTGEVKNPQQAPKTGNEPPAATTSAPAGVTFGGKQVNPSPSLEERMAAAQGRAQRAVNGNLTDVGQILFATAPTKYQAALLDNNGLADNANAVLGQPADNYLAWLSFPGNKDVGDNLGSFLEKNPKNMDKLRKQWPQMRRELESLNGGPSQETLDQITEAISTLGNAKVFAPTSKVDPFYIPDKQNPKPQAIPEVVALGSDLGNYQQAYAGMSPEAKKLVNEWKGEDPQALGAHVADYVASVQDGLQNVKPGPRGVPEVDHEPDYLDADDLMEHKDGNPAVTNILMAHQQAYSFVVAGQLAQSLSPDGGSPFDPAPSGAPQKVAKHDTRRTRLVVVR
jgi:hypothetical protein